MCAWAAWSWLGGWRRWAGVGCLCGMRGAFPSRGPGFEAAAMTGPQVTEDDLDHCCDGDGQQGAEGCGNERDQVGDADKQRDQPAERDADALQDRIGQKAADHADEQVAGDVAGDGLGTVGAYRPNVLRTVVREQGKSAADQF